MKNLSTLVFISCIFLISSLRIKQIETNIYDPFKTPKSISKLTIIKKPVIRELLFVPYEKIDEILPNHQEIQKQIQNAKKEDMVEVQGELVQQGEGQPAMDAQTIQQIMQTTQQVGQDFVPVQPQQQ